MISEIKTVGLSELFLETFGKGGTIETFFAPGRINLIGEHIDYNGGFVFPASLNIGITALVRKRNDQKVMMCSTNIDGRVEVDLTQPVIYSEKDGWGNYPKGVIAKLKSKNIDLIGCDILFSSNLPDGAGLSSSAAIEVLTYYLFMNSAGINDFNKVNMAKECQEVENKFIGVNCGIMDQFSIAMGLKNHAMLLDCETLEHQYIPVELKNYTLVIMNTNKRRELAESKYNERRSECDEALKIIDIKGVLPNLCTASLNQVEVLLSNHSILQKRARHVVSENIRVMKSVEVLKQGNSIEFGRLLSASHESLKKDYEVTGAELDAIVEAAQNAKGCIGARMTGAGFGGCAIALVEKDAIPTFKKEVSEVYTAKTGLVPSYYESSIGDGVHKVNA